MTICPLISTVLPVYNGERYVEEAVESILAQDFTNFELIIINDGSTDKSGTILRKLAEKDSRIRLIERENDGLISALNQGISLAKADFIARMDADDIATPDRFRLQYEYLKNNESVGLLGSFIKIIGKQGEFIRLGDYPVTAKETLAFIEKGSPLAHPAVMMRKDAVVAAGGYRRMFRHCEDYDLWLRISELGYGIENYSKPLLHYRVHGENVSAVHSEAQILGTIVAILAHRARKANLPDPCDSVDVITAELIEAFPEAIRKDLKAALFVKQHGNISLASSREIIKAWDDYKALPDFMKRETIMCSFLMRVLNGAIRKKHFILAGQALAIAFMRHPSSAAQLLNTKLSSRT